MSVKLRQRLERAIARRAAVDIIRAGYSITVSDGEKPVIDRSTNVDAIMGVMFSTDMDMFLVHDYRSLPRLNDCIGWVKFVYGNDGWDVIHDYTINLDDCLSRAHALAERYED